MCIFDSRRRLLRRTNRQLLRIRSRSNPKIPQRRSTMTSQNAFKQAWLKRNAPVLCDYSEAKIITWDASLSLSQEEQELVLTLSRQPKELKVYCSHQSYIFKLKKLSAFKVSRILLNKTGLILSIDGHLPANALTLRKVKV